jgi:hypothetical protein
MSTDDTPEEGAEANPPRKDAEVDEEEEESFPASDPPSSWAGPKSNTET